MCRNWRVFAEFLGIGRSVAGCLGRLVRGLRKLKNMTPRCSWRPAAEGEGQLKLYGKKKLGWVTVALQTIKQIKMERKKGEHPPPIFFQRLSFLPLSFSNAT